MSAFQHVKITYDSPGRWPGFSFAKRNGPGAGHAPGPQNHTMSVQAETAPTLGWAPRRSRPHIRAQIRAQNLHSGEKWQMGRLTLSYPGLWCGTSFDIYPMEFDADQLLGPPYRCAPDALSGDQKCKLRRDADRVGYLKRRSSLGLVTNETGDCAPADLDASGLHEATPGRAVRRPNWEICATCSHARPV